MLILLWMSSALKISKQHLSEIMPAYFSNFLKRFQPEIVWCKMNKALFAWRAQLSSLVESACVKQQLTYRLAAFEITVCETGIGKRIFLVDFGLELSRRRP